MTKLRNSPVVHSLDDKTFNPMTDNLKMHSCNITLYPLYLFSDKLLDIFCICCKVNDAMLKSGFTSVNDNCRDLGSADYSPGN